MDARLAARMLAGGRLSVGLALVIAPRRILNGWVGGELSRRPAVQALARAMGARDLVMGMIAMHTLDHPQVGPRWQLTCGAVDLTDALATVAARGDLPLTGALGVGTLAGGSALVEALLWRALRHG